MKTVKVVIEMAKDGHYSAYMPGDEVDYSVIGTGSSIEKAVADFNAGYEEMKAYCAEEGEPFEEAEFSFSYDIASFLSYYKDRLSLAGLQRVTGVAQGQLSHYLTGRSKPSKKTVEKMQTAIKSFAEELGRVHLV